MDSETAAFVMGANPETHLQRAKKARAKNVVGSRLRAGFGVPGIYYGFGAYGSPIGNVTGVGNPAPPAEGGMTPPEAMSTDQFGGAAGGGEGGGGMSAGGGV